MDLMVNRFKVRYQGRDYGPGSVIYGVSDDLAKKLITDSNGTIEALPEKTSENTSSDNGNIGQTGTTKNAANNQTGDAATGLPPVDPGKTVK